ncbi:hypothetical protein jhhlp_001966 [Lomentospora prolificans]|uniref:Uncharacterized protein n=1 Tax=Lomentospora prolificans TaxID=41688 RepID=A0A2N3NCM6_9PEZI|nr:hypothetical protein jhhlp_001966 [Lomentospora prolificans]
MATTRAPTAPSACGPGGQSRDSLDSTESISTRSTSIHDNGTIRKDQPRSMREPHCCARSPHDTSQHPLTSILRAATPRSSALDGSIRPPEHRRIRRSSSSSTTGRTRSNDPCLIDGSLEIPSNPASPWSPLVHYQGPTPKTVDEVRAAFFATRGLNLLSIKEWEGYCLHADMQVLATAMKNEEVDGDITGYNEIDGFTGSAALRGTLKIWLLSQEKFNRLKVLELWSRLANPAWASGIAMDDAARWLVDGLPLSHSTSSWDIESEAATFEGYEHNDADVPAVDRPQGAAIKRLNAAEIDARIPAVQTRLLCKVISGTLKKMAIDISDARMKVKAAKKSRFSASGQQAVYKWPWSEDEKETASMPFEIDSKDEDQCPFSLVARSVNNILKSGHRKMDEQIAKTEQARLTAEDLRQQLNEKLGLCATIIQKLGRGEKLVNETKSRFNTLRESFISLDRSEKQNSSHMEEIRDTEKQLDFLKEDLERYVFKGKLFDELCQEIKMMPYHIESVGVAHLCFGALRNWVGTKEEAIARKWQTRNSQRHVDGSEATGAGFKEIAAPYTAGDERFSSFESPESLTSRALSVDENGYEGAGEEEEGAAIDAF